MKKIGNVPKKISGFGRLSKKTEKRLSAKWPILIDAAAGLNETLDISSIMNKLVVSAMALTDSTAGTAGFMKNGKMVFSEYNSHGTVKPIDYSFEAGYGVPGWVIENHKPYFTNDAEHDPHVIQSIRQSLGFYNLANVPILSRTKKLLGCFEIHNTKNMRPFDEQDIEMLCILAGLAAVALGNTRLLDYHKEFEKHEIEERKQTEETLQNSQALYGSLVENVPLSIFRKDLKGRITFGNKKYFQMMGKSPEKLIGMTDREFFPQELAEKYIEDDKRVMETEETLDEVEEHQLSNGKRIHVRVIKTPLYDSANKIIGIQGIFWDITRRKLAEKAMEKAKSELENRVKERTVELSETNKRLRQEISDRQLAEEEIARLARFPNENPNPVLRIAADGAILYSNMPSDPLLDAWNCRQGEKLSGKWYRLMLESLAAGQPQQGEIEYEGQVFTLTFAPIMDANYVNIYGFDITIRKRMEIIRDELYRELTLKNEELESILYVASHDLRSPLVNIQGFSNELSRSCDFVRSNLAAKKMSFAMDKSVQSALNEEIPEALNFILTSATKIDLLLSGLLRLSRLGREAINIELIDMNKMIANICGSMEYQIKESGANVKIEELPECHGDASQINQVFSNLLDNAVKFLDDSRGGLIRIHGKTEDGDCVYCVEDNGVGIAQDHQKKIFETFHRLEPELTSGEGLGLTIVRRIIDRHNGRVWVESEYGVGSKFFISLPCT